MKKTAKKLLSMALVLVMVLSMLPAVATPALAAENENPGTLESFGIAAKEWTAEERAEAEANLPFGTGYGTWTTLLEKSELFFSMGYDNATRLTGMFDWNEKVTNTGTLGDIPDSAIGSNVAGFTQGGLASRNEKYKAVATAAMDLNGTGKKEYVANLALNASGNTLYLYVTDSSNNRVAGTKTFNNVAQLSSMEVHQINGAFSIAAGDFDGDGKDTVVVYVPQTDSSKATKNGTSPSIREYSFTVSDSGVSYTEESTVSSNVLTLLGNTVTDVIDTMKNQPMVDLLAEDVDKDGFDELIVTAGMNDVTNSDHYLESHVFIYDKLSSRTKPANATEDGNWHRSYDKKMAIIEASNKRVVWASSTVGNIMVSTSTGVDYPEIVSAGFIDGEQNNTQHINVGGSDDIGVTAVRVKSDSTPDKTNTFEITSQNGKTLTAVNAICEYEEVLNQKISANGWTKGGFYESEDVNSLLQVQAYADRGLGSAEAVFISGTVYRVNNNDELAEAYKHGDFKSKDDFAGSNGLTNTTVTAVTAGNFNGNDDGREQLIFVTTLKQSGKNNAYSRVYCYYNEATCDANGTWTDKFGGKPSGYLTEHKGSFYVTLAALDTDKDSTIAKLESVDRAYTTPDVLAILEASPYFAEIEDSVGNSETTYGTSSSSGSGSSNSFGFTLGTSVGYEFESTLTQSGGGFELAFDNAFNWTTANTTTVEWFTEFRNDTGDNLVVVYSCPVVTYTYKDQNNKTLVVEKVGQPATSMITVDEYNAAAAQSTLDLINDDNGIKLGEPGDPASYRSTSKGLDNAVQYNGTGNASSSDTTAGWTQYYGSGSVMQGLTITKEQEKTFSYDMAVSLNVFAKVGGVTVSATYGFTYAYEKTSINGSSVTKSGAVTGTKVAGYDFKWKFAAWNCTLNGSTVPVIGYLVKDVVSPPSPAMGLTAESITTDSITLRWSNGPRPAEQYRIYRVLDTGSYALVGAVQGDQSSCKLTGLKSGETYTYVVRGVGYDEAKNALESVDSAPITVRTQSENSSVSLSLHGSSLTDGKLQSTGERASIRVEVSDSSSGNGTVAYQWQILEAGTEGIKNGWLSVSDLANKTIKTVNGATSSTLTLTVINKSLNGSSLRCVVTVTSEAGDVETYYSPIATLDLNGLDTTTAISVTAKNENETVGGTGSIDDPYTGMADYTEIEAGISVGIKLVPKTIKQGEITYTIYQDATDNTNPVYVGVYDAVNTENGTSSRTYYAVTKTVSGSTETYTLGNMLTLEADKYFHTDDNDAYNTISFVGFNGVNTVYKTVETGENAVTYVKLYAVAETGLTEYWLNTTDGLYYKPGEGENSFVEADPQPADDTDLRTVYYDNNGTVILSAGGDNGYDHYQVYTVNGSAATAGDSFYRVPGTKLYNGTTAYADSAELETVIVEEEVSYSTSTTTPMPGTPLTLSAIVSYSNGGEISTPVTFAITNTDTGVVTQVTATNGTATWTAPKYGLYRIVATAAATNSTNSSSAVCYYRADDPNNSYRLTVWQGNEQVTNISYNGADVELKLEQGIYDETTQTFSWVKLDSGVSYKANGVDLDSSAYTLGAAGNYIFSAVVDGKTVATAVLVVNKASITVTPQWGSTEGATNTIPAYSEIDLVVTDAQGKALPDFDLTNVMTVSCDLYDNDGTLDANAASGVYTVTPAYVNDAAKTNFLSCYSVTLNTATIYYFSDAITVHFDAGENGKVYARYIDPSGTEFSFSDGSPISMDYRLKFVAAPDSGWSVGKWTVKVATVDTDPVAEGWCSIYSNTLEITEAGMENLKALMGSGQKQITVSVTFTNQTHKITYSAGNGGSLSAAAGGSPLISGASVAHNATVTFTATPDDGQMVEKWTVGGAEYKWDGTDALYRENTLTLENISAAHDVKVFFTNAATTNVSVSAVDTNSAPYSATVTVTDAQGNELTGNALASVPQSSALIFTAAIGNSASAVIQEWQTSTDGNTWTTVTGSGGQNAITIYEHSGELYVRVVIAVAQVYKLNWKIMEGGAEITDTSIANLVAKSGNITLTNDRYYAVNTPVDFTLRLADAYEVVGWSDNVTDDGNTAALSSLTEDTTVTVTVREKPAVTIHYSVENESATGGTLSAQVNGTELATDGSACYDQTVTFTAAAADGYRVKAWTLDGKTWTDAGTNKKTALDLSGYENKAEADRIVTVTVEFMPIGNQITCSAGENGHIVSAMIGEVSYDFTNGFTAQANAEVVITAAPDTGYEVKAWKVNGETQVDETGDTFTYTADGTIGAVISVEFQCVAYTINWTAENGTVTAEGQTGSSAQIRGDETVTFTATPDTGYVFDHWTVDGVKPENATSASFDWTVPTGVEAGTAYNIRAVFVEATEEYTVTYSAGDNGTISAPGGENGSVTVASGGSVTFTATPNAHYMVKGWKVDGTDVPDSSNQKTYTLENVRKDCTVTVEFETAALMKVDFAVDGANGTLTAQADGTPLTTGEYVPGGSDLVFTAAPAEGYMVESWKVNGETQSELSNTLTIDSLTGNVTVKVAFEPLVLHTIPDSDMGYTISSITKIPADYGAANQIRSRGTVSFTVGLADDYVNIKKLIINGYDCIADELVGDRTAPDNCLSVAAVGSANGSYTVTITGVTGDIIADIEAHKVVVGSLSVPAAFEGNEELDSVDKIQAKLETKMTASSDGKVFYDIALKYRDGDNWVEVTEENFPANGVDVVLPYPAGTDSKDTFTIIHMLTTKGNEGKLEIIAHEKKTDGLHFHVDSLSPFAIGWSKYTAPSGGGGGGGGGAMPTETVIIKDSVNGKVTADNTCAEEGDTVTLTVEPDKGYTLETLIVTDKNGDELKLKDKGNGKYTFTMPASNVTVKATFMEDNSMLNFFVDVPADAYYYDAVLWAAKEGITGGTDATHFSPNATCTRAQAVTFLWRAAGSPAPQSHAMPFTDVAEGSYYHDAVLWAVENGITKGTSDTTFTPNAKCTRAQIVTFLWRSQKSPASGSVNPFTDVAADAYYANAVLWAVENGITAGTTAATFSPNNDCTRAQIVTFLYRCMK